MPAPDPPTKGWWIDPEDPTMIRRHNGKRWTHSTIRRYVQRRPAGQGLFLLGAGEEGIPAGGPLASRRSIAYDWCNRVGIFLLDGTVCALGLFTLYLLLFKREELEKYDRKAPWVFLALALAVPGFFLWRTWDRLLDALWISAYAG